MIIAGGRNSTTPAVKTVYAIATVTNPSMSVAASAIDVKLYPSRTKTSTIEIANVGSGLLTWTASVDPGTTTWLKLSGAGGDVQPDNATTVKAALASKGLSDGVYTATIKLTSNDAQHATKDIPVKLTVQTDLIRDKHVLLEEFTGTWCGWCPYGVDVIHELEGVYGDKLNVASHHYNDAMSILPNSTIVFYLKGSYFPGATVDRTKFAAEADTIVDRDTWATHIGAIMTATPQAPIGIGFTKKAYNPANKQMMCTVAVKFYDAVSIPTKITMLQTESGFNYKQGKFNWTPAILDPFFHENVVRQIMPDVFGEELTSGATAAGTTIEHDFAFTSADSILTNSVLLVIVEENAGAQIGPVLQTYSEGLVDGVEGAVGIDPITPPAAFALHQNYPNPFSTSATTISYSVPKTALVHVSVFDMLGRQVANLVDGMKDAGTYSVPWNTRNLPAGMYLCKLEADGSTITRNMTIVK
jgi:hypothetical protein